MAPRPSAGSGATPAPGRDVRPSAPAPLVLLDDVSLRALNTFGVQARARRFARLEHEAQVPAALEAAAAASRTLLLGGGSNLLFAGDYDGLVLAVALRGRRVVSRTATECVVEAAAGEPWDPFVRWTLEQGLSGLENLALIPGSVGASPLQNIGAYGVEMCERFDELLAVDRHTGERRVLRAAECRFGYRHSIFKEPQGERWLILSVRFRLALEFTPQLGYAALRAAFPADRPPASAREVADRVSAIRRSKLPDPAQVGNAGSFFENPVVTPAQAAALAERHPGLPHWQAGQGVKLAAAWLIEQCGWKGVRRGDAGVHDRHALVLVNHGNASGAQILALADEIRASVRHRFGVSLRIEPRVVT